MPITDFHTYGKLIYSLQERYPSVQRCTLVLATIGPTLAKLEGQIPHPHHKHISPDLKHNRIPAPGISFKQPNLPTLIEEIEREVLPSSPSIS